MSKGFKLQSRFVIRWTIILSVAMLLIIPFQNFGPTPDDSISLQPENSTNGRQKFLPQYIYARPDRSPSSVSLPTGYVSSGKISYKSSSEDIPDEEWIKNTEKKFYFTFNKSDDDNAAASNTDPSKPKKNEVTWQVINRDGKGKIQYYGPVKMEAEYNIGTGESALKFLEPLSKQSQMSIEANTKDSKGTLNYNYTW